MVWLILTVMLKRWASVKCSNRKRWWLAEYRLTWLSSTWSRASRALSCTEFSGSTTAGTTPCSHAFCTTVLWWRLTASSSPTHCRAFFFTDTAGSLQRSDSVARFSQLRGITLCFRRPTRVCVEMAEPREKRLWTARVALSEGSSRHWARQARAWPWTVGESSIRRSNSRFWIRNLCGRKEENSGS
ncbi:hypothetical protein EYF80_041011 [Liparis tanakae]|uniref:Secreted protein n=1 Tax=Liparis tanakae TaxID=230148 RepID=A0A4Z2G852_9TELE|nr:hypothetical protein EYF80_041011 [Liparis tanakae]